MKKYLFVFRTSLQRFVEYRGELVMDVIGKIVLPMFVQFILWQAITADSGGSFAGYDFARLMEYMAFSILIFNLMNVNFVEREIANAIREGDLNKFLSKPIDFMLYYFAVFLADNFPVFVASFALYLAAAATGWIALVPLNLTLGLIVIFAGMFLAYIMSFLIAMLAFWMEEVWTLFVMKNLTLWFLTGQLIPLDLFPDEAQRVMRLLPFGYLSYFPAKVLTNSLALPDIGFGLGVMAAWSILFYLLYAASWNYALNKYGAFGG